MHADALPQVHEQPTVPGSAASEHDCPPALEGVRVLVVDDEVDALQIVKRVLEICGCTVLTAGSADEALELIQQHSPQVLISDIGMPGQDGFELLKKVRSLAPEKGGRVPAIALTAFARTDDRRKAMMAGFQLHMAKPVESAELIAAVANVAGLTGRS